MTFAAVRYCLSTNSCTFKQPPHSVMQCSQSFQAGDLVDVKNHGRATVVEPPVTDPGHPHCGRVLVKYHEDDTTFYANPKRLRKLKLSTRRVVVCYRTEHYRAAAVHNVDRPDICLEVGSHNGTTTRILHNRVTYVVGIDNVQLMVDQARARSPHVRFELADGFDIEQLRSLSPTGDYDKILVDLSGKAPLWLISRMLTLHLDAFPHSKIIVKNEALFMHLEELERQQAQQQAAAGAQQQDVQQQQEQDVQQPEQRPAGEQGGLGEGDLGQLDRGGQPASAAAQGAEGGCPAHPRPGTGTIAGQSIDGHSRELSGSNGLAQEQQHQQQRRRPQLGQPAAAEEAEARGAGGPASNSAPAAAAGDLPAFLVEQCELFRERYASQPTTVKGQKQKKWRGDQRPGAPQPSASGSAGSAQQ